MVVGSGTACERSVAVHCPDSEIKSGNFCPDCGVAATGAVRAVVEVSECGGVGHQVEPTWRELSRNYNR